ncbi:MAG: cadherin-like beta sandwich domain-containing protein [Bacilli bacterium]|nr:cadherin-like beta sandwich domain-containing protein [Bacilli bacterium]
MKKIKYLFIALLLTIPITGRAAVIHCSAPSSVESGETFTVTFSGSLNSSASVWFASIGSSSNVTYAGGDGLSIPGKDGASMSHSVRFTAGNPGTASFYAYDVDVSDGVNSYSDSDTCYVEITSATKPNGASANIYDGVYGNDDDDEEKEIDPDKASNSYLKSLSIEGVKISPAFNKDKMEYSAVVPGDKEKIVIKGEVEDEKATVEGLGEVELKEGINKIEIKVTAENGEERKYILTITRKEKNPIEVTINKKKYTVVKKEIGLKVPEGFVKTTVTIDKQEVVAYSNKFTGYLIVALVDEDGKASWFIYNQKNGTYTKYSELKSNGLRLIILDAKKKDVPYRYKKTEFKINDEIVEGYALELGSNYRLVYALNMDTGNKGFYLYDMEENTFQRFYNTQVNIYRSLVKKLEIVLIALAGIILLMGIVIVSIMFINRKTKKFIKNGGKVEEEKPIIDEEDEEEKKEELKNKIKEKSEEIDRQKLELARTRRITPINENKTEEKVLTREEIKRRKKEEKEELEKMRREFFDL